MPDAPVLPPLLSGIPVSETTDPLAATARDAVTGRLGAGDLVWSQATDRAACALVLEPDRPLDEALQMVPLMMIAIGDALGAIGPPNLGIMVQWPATLLANGGAVGGVRVAVPEGVTLDEVPDFLVVGFEIALRLPEDLREAPGHAAHLTALHEEGAGDIDRNQLIGAVARHFLSWLDAWEHSGFTALRQAFAALLLKPQEVAGTRLLRLDGSAGALLEDGRAIPLAKALGVG